MSTVSRMPIEGTDGSVLHVAIFDEIFDGSWLRSHARCILDTFLHPPVPQPPIGIDDVDWNAPGEHAWLVVPAYVVPEQRSRGVVQWLPGGVPAQIGATP